jgi:hypothetical protein
LFQIIRTVGRGGEKRREEERGTTHCVLCAVFGTCFLQMSARWMETKRRGEKRREKERGTTLINAFV